MTEEEEIERNKQIAIMLNWIDADGDLVVPKHLDSGYDYGEWADTKDVTHNELYEGCVLFHYINVTQVGFSSDWNWLMEAVSVIHLILTPSDSRKHDLIQVVGRGNKEAVFIAVSNFAKLYNEGKL